MTHLPPDPQNPAASPTPAPPAGAPMAYPPQAPQDPAGQPPQYQPGAAPVLPGKPPKGGLPAWAWVVLSIVAALFIGIIIALAVVVPKLVNEFSAEINPTPTQPAPQPAPSEAPDAETGTTFSLDDQVPLAAGPFWSVEFDDDWAIDIFDVDGVNQFTNASSSCTLYTFQGTGNPDATSANDGLSTKLTIPVALKLGLPWDASGEPEAVPIENFNLKLDLGPDTVDMEQLSAKYTSTSGEARERVFLLRAFQPSNNVLLAQVDCPEGSPMISERLDGLAVTQY